MDSFVIDGPVRLEGTVAVGGAKNAVLPAMTAALLTEGTSRLERVPHLRDTATMAHLLRVLGARVEHAGGTLRIDTSTYDYCEAPYELVKTMRASIYCLGPLLAKKGRAKVSLPGGCAWGPRPVDLHLMGMEKLGARISLSHGYVIAEAPHGLRGTEIFFEISSVGATINVMMAAVLAQGKTTLVNAAREPEVAEIAETLNQAGARIEGAGGYRIEIQGVRELRPLEHAVMADRIEAGTFLIAGMMTGGDVRVEHCRPDHLHALLEKMQQMGAEIEVGDTWVRVHGSSTLQPVDVTTAPYPGFPTDLQAQIMAALARANGVSLVTETIYPDRFTHVPELRRLGAKIRLDGNIAVVTGGQGLSGAPVMATDLRASAALILSAFAAEGRTVISRVYHMDRGYERIEEKFAALGAAIERGRERDPAEV
ncbi:MAG TPA: UDP-N-acetylglucosamine 1-carboxyvinyltransferase [Candidatus Krumholzibacteria bacterium]|nr:UDP-N-acetylglucosamine 1-carboxyvinyltransferase [Candidatus Krumholzibacteria bacterium]